MRHINSYLLFMFFLTGIVTASCAKKDIYIDLTANDWEVVKIKKQGESSYDKANNSYVLHFTTENTFTINLDVNNCFGEYEITCKGNIIFKAMICTQVCCDSEFAQDLGQLLPKMTSYYGKGDELLLEGEGKIILKEK